MSNYVIKVYDKDNAFKRTIPRAIIDGDIWYSSVLDSGYWGMALDINAALETLAVTDTTYERLLDPTYRCQDTVDFTDYRLNITNKWVIQLRWDKDIWWWTWDSITLYANNTKTYTESDNFTLAVKFKIVDRIWYYSWIFWSWYRFAIYHSWSTLIFSARWSNVINYQHSNALIEWETYIAGIRYRALDWTYHPFLDGIDIQPWGFNASPTFTFESQRIGDTAIWNGDASSSHKDIYRAWFWNKFFSKEEIESQFNWNLIVDWIENYYSGKYDRLWASGIPIRILNALPDNSKKTLGGYTSNLGIINGDIIKVIDPTQNTVTESTYERLLNSSYNGTVSGGVTIVDDAIVFDGVDGYATIWDTSALNPAWSFSMYAKWVIWDSTTQISTLIANRSGGTWLWFIFGWQKFQANLFWLSDNFFTTANNTFLNWVSYEIIFVYDGINATLYNSDWSIIKQEATTWVITSSWLNAYLWRMPSYPGRDYKGSVEKILFYHTDLSETERNATFNWWYVTDWLVLSYTGQKFSGTASSPTTIINALPDNSKKTIEDTSIYTGVVSRVGRNITPQSDIFSIDCIGYQSILAATIYTSWGLEAFTKNADPAVILKEILDLLPGYFSYDGASIPDYGSSINVSFDSDNCIKAIGKILDITGRHIVYSGTGKVYFFGEVADPEPDHILKLGNEINGIELQEDIDELVNSIKVVYDGGSVVDTDAASIALYNTKKRSDGDIVNNDIKDAPTAALFAAAYLERYANARQVIAIYVNNKYNLSSIKPGDVVKVLGDPTNIGTKYIKKVKYQPDSVVLELYDSEGVNDEIKKLLAL